MHLQRSSPFLLKHELSLRSFYYTGFYTIAHFRISAPMEIDEFNVKATFYFVKNVWKVSVSSLYKIYLVIYAKFHERFSFDPRVDLYYLQNNESFWFNGRTES